MELLVRQVMYRINVDPRGVGLGGISARRWLVDCWYIALGALGCCEWGVVGDGVRKSGCQLGLVSDRLCIAMPSFVRDIKFGTGSASALGLRGVGFARIGGSQHFCNV